MRKLILLVLVGMVLLFLAACGEESVEDSEGEEVSSEEVAETTPKEPAEELTFENASEGDEVITDAGTYTIVKATDSVGEFESGPVNFSVNKAFLAEFTPKESEAFLFENEPNVDGTIHALVTIVTAENSGEEYVTFSPFYAEVFVGGSKPYRGQAYLNEGESDISAGKSEEFVTAHNLEDEDLASVTEVIVKQSGPAADNMRIGDDVEFTISFD